MPLLSLSQYCIHATLISDCLTETRGGGAIKELQSGTSGSIESVACCHSTSEKLVVIESSKTAISHPLHFVHIQIKKHLGSLD